MLRQKDYEIKITHIMADGTVRDSIEGVVIPINEKTKLFYDTILGRKKDTISNSIEN